MSLSFGSCKLDGAYVEPFMIQMSLPFFRAPMMTLAKPGRLSFTLLGAKVSVVPDQSNFDSSMPDKVVSRTTVSLSDTVGAL